MPNLVGIGLSQVPTNSMLGGLAYQDPEHASIKDLDLKNLSQINSEIADTAVDIFIYDTSKDSDGGAWRKRTQHTSWYNETLGTSVRGTRREFPAVAVIVVENTSITIYDGDDPDLPMWMVFNTVNGMINTNGNNLNSVSMLNGILVWSSFRSGIISFIPESAELLESGYAYHLRYGLVNRNISGGWNTTTGRQIVNNNCNDVAMTVLPNAPIDDATGLPVPTIAVATDRGVSIIKDDGVVVDLEHDGGTHETCRNVAFSEDNTKVLFESDVNDDNTFRRRVIVEDIPLGDTTYTVIQNDSYQTTTGGYDNGGPRILGGDTSSTGINEVLPQAIASGEGITFLDNELDDILSSRVAYATTSYNTGWMHGDIKGAFLSDTDTTNVTGEKVDLTNGSNAGGDAAGNFSSITSNELVAGSTSDTIGRYNTGTTLVTGKQYYATLTISNYSGSDTLGVSSGGGFDTTFRYNANGTYTRYITGASGEIQIFYRSSNSATIGLTIKEVDPDRSVNYKGLQVFGTITKSAVATGAELVSYSGFSSTNKLIQPYNSDMNYGTGDLYIMLWAKHIPDGSSIAYYLFDRADTDATNRIGSYYIPSSNRLDIYSPSQTLNANGLMPSLSEWSHIAFVRQNSTGYLYVNGNLIKTQTGMVENLTGDGTAELKIGARFNGAEPWTIGNLALFRTGSSTPSATQIKKIYEDEKHLFQENAKCTLYGSSNAVTGLAHDDSTDILHVGTSAGRSEFQGLRRINNTTTAVTTAISAHDEFIIEQ